MKTKTPTSKASEIPHYDEIKETMQYLFSDFGQAVIGEFARRVVSIEQHHKEYTNISQNIKKIIRGKKGGPTLLALSYVMVDLICSDLKWKQIIELEKEKQPQTQGIEVA